MECRKNKHPSKHYRRRKIPNSEIYFRMFANGESASEKVNAPPQYASDYLLELCVHA